MSLPPYVARHVDAEADAIRQTLARIAVLNPLCAIGLTYTAGATPIVSSAALLVS